MKQIATIQYYRGLFACWIALWHAYVVFGRPMMDRPTALYFFMMVTGFFCFRSTRPASGAAGPFLVYRLIRIAPVYWIATLLLALKVALHLSHRDEALDPGRLLLSLLFIPHFDARHQMLPLLAPGWYLTYDVFLSLVLSALLWAPPARRLPLLTALYLGLAAWGLAFHPADPIGARMTDQIMIAFVAGAWLGRLLPEGAISPWVAAICCPAGFLLYYFPWKPATDAHWPMLVAGLPALLMLISAIGLGEVEQRPIRWLQRLGDSAFSIYIWHVLAISLVASLFEHVPGAPFLLKCLLATAAGAVLGVVLHERLEIPLTALLTRVSQRWFARDRRLAVGA